MQVISTFSPSLNTPSLNTNIGSGVKHRKSEDCPTIKNFTPTVRDKLHF